MKHTVNGRASICTWELNFSFRDKDQVRRFVELLLEDEVDFNFEYCKQSDDVSELHLVTVCGCWANNLVRVSKLAEQVDYKESFGERYETWVFG